MKPIYKKYCARLSLVWACSLIVFVLLHVLVTRPQKRVREGLERDLSQKRLLYERARAAAQEQTRSEWKKQIENMENRLGDFAIDSEDSGNLTFDIGQIAKEEQAFSFSIRGKDGSAESPIPDGERVAENYLNVNFAAGFTEFATLLNALERHRPVVFVDRFTLSRSTKGDSKHPVNMELAVLVVKRPGAEGAEAM
ncbi:MAG TPA: GspMb/PilO family protein [Sedimentisphaerales bacterium]|nr:GspMb/PilO family protein [Sedimentisphaerales bacterium]